MASEDGFDVAMLVLRAATQIIDGIQRGLAERGFDDVRPAHGFAFVRISEGDATVVDVAEHLGVTKQSASQLVAQLVQRGYVTRELDPRDGRARILQLTERGRACTHAAERAAADVVRTWAGELGAQEMDRLRTSLHTVVTPGRLRPVW